MSYLAWEAVQSLADSIARECSLLSYIFQVRQHTEHKRTFLYLEQLILKHNADSNCISIKDIHEVCFDYQHS